MRYVFFALVVLISGTAGVFLVHRELQAAPPIVLPAPTQIQVQVGGLSALAGGWTNSSTVRLSAVVPSAVNAGLDVEVQPAGQGFTNSPTISNTPAQASCAATSSCATKDPGITLHLQDGAYHWQVRLHNGQGISPWVPYKSMVRVDATSPTAPQISSATDPVPGKRYRSSRLQFSWQATDFGSGIAGYSYRFDTDAHGQARTALRTSETAVNLSGISTGSYYFHVRALDHAGNWSPSTTFPVRIDTSPPKILHVRFSQFQFNPQFNPLQVSFAVGRQTKSLHVGVYRQSDQQLVRLYRLSNLAKGQVSTIVWNGRDGHGNLMGAGTYEIYVRATDRFGNSGVTGWRDFHVVYQRIVVSLSQQKLWAYNGNQLLLSSLVTTGNRALPTPIGTTYIMGKFHPFTFHSPWPKSSPYYYPPSPVQYAMLFREGGYFIHDAPWRSAFGPGTNSQLGTPGSNLTGTHGCVNTPPDVATRLFAWVQIGTIVQVVP